MLRDVFERASAWLSMTHLCSPWRLVVSIGFFGLDEVAEILESPFSLDPNAINLRNFSDDLIRDLDVGRLPQVHWNLKESGRQWSDCFAFLYLFAVLPERRAKRT